MFLCTKLPVAYARRSQESCRLCTSMYIALAYSNEMTHRRPTHPRLPISHTRLPNHRRRRRTPWNPRRCALAPVNGFAAASSSEGGTGGVAHETTICMGSCSGSMGKCETLMCTPRRQLTFGNRTQGPSIPLRRKITQPRTISTSTPNTTGSSHHVQLSSPSDLIRKWVPFIVMKHNRGG